MKLAALLYPDFNSIAQSGFGLGNGVGRQLEDRRGLQANRGQTPGAKIGLQVHHDGVAIEVDDIDRKPHTQSMNAMAGSNPEAAAITEVILGGSQQAAQP